MRSVCGLRRRSIQCIHDHTGPGPHRHLTIHSRGTRIVPILLPLTQALGITSMKFIQSVISLRITRCECCSSQGALCFYSCPKCDHTALICDEVGTVFLNPKDLTLANYGGLDNPSCLCPSGDGVHISEFIPSRHDQVLALGFTQEEFR